MKADTDRTSRSAVALCVAVFLTGACSSEDARPVAEAERTPVMVGTATEGRPTETGATITAADLLAALDAETGNDTSVVVGPSVNPSDAQFSPDGRFLAIEINVAGNAGDTETNVVTATGVDDDGGPVSGTDDETVTIGVTVDPVDDIFDDSVTTNEDTPTGPIAFTVGDVETAAGTLTVTATSNDQTLIPDGNNLKCTAMIEFGDVELRKKRLAELVGMARLAAAELPSVNAVATIGAPADPAHVLQHIDASAEEIERDGEATVRIAGRPFRVKRQFLEDLEALKNRFHCDCPALKGYAEYARLILNADDARLVAKAGSYPGEIVWFSIERGSLDGLPGRAAVLFALDGDDFVMIDGKQTVLGYRRETVVPGSLPTRQCRLRGFGRSG